MITSSEQLANDDYPLINPAKLQPISSTINLEIADPSLSSNRFAQHHQKAGVNPLVDAAAYLFSIMGKLRQLKSYRHLNKLHKELVLEINTFQDTAKALNYSSEYILVSRYALCASLDDIIINTVWGAQGQWETYSLLTAFNQEPVKQGRFFIILERIIKDPTLYIDLMEFMYLCLSLGFKGAYRSTEFGSNQLEQICNALYKRIRAHHGGFSKTLSPYPIKAASPAKLTLRKSTSVGFATLTTASIILALFIGMEYLLDTISNQAYQELMHIGKSMPYEIHTP